MDTKEMIRRILPSILVLIVLAVFMLPEKLETRAAEKFGEPLFSHALPDGAELVQTDAGKNEDGSIMAAIILKTDLTSDALEAFYGNTEYPPAEEGQTVTLSCQPLNEDSITALKQAKLYEDGASYQFVFISSK